MKENLFGEMESEEMPQGKVWAYERSETGKDEWLTPPEIIRALSVDFNGQMFCLDPCAPVKRPWEMAKDHFTIQDNGLLKMWHGRVWCNPPYADAAQWLARCTEHGNAIALVFARTETRMFFEYVWKRAHAVLFIRGRLQFYHVDGSRGRYLGGAPSCLIAYSECNVDALEFVAENKKIDGYLVYLNGGR